MRLAIDARMVGPVPHGFARYVTRIADGLAELHAKKPLSYEPVFVTSPEFAPGSAEAKTTFRGFETAVAKAPFLHPSELFELPRVLRRLHADFYHSPSFSSLLVSPCPWLVTVHDLNHLTYGGLKQKLYYRLLLKSFARGARALLTDSDFSRDELAAWTGRPAREIQVVAVALDPSLSRPAAGNAAEVLRARGVRAGEYFFCLSNPKPHKNIELLLRAYAVHHRSRRTEAAAWPLLLNFPVEDASPGVKGLGSLGDLEARVLMENAGGFLFPSLYEGFGLPPIEAASLGVPLAVSRIRPHEEGLAGLGPDEARWVEPSSLEGWVGAFGDLEDRKIRGASAATRARLLARFDVSTFGETMDRIYRNVLGFAS